MLQALLRLLRRSPFMAALFGPTSDQRARDTGRPSSANGASSFHLIWDLPHTPPIVEVSARLEIDESPTVDRLYFWALQAGFASGNRSVGGAHLGLQFHPAYPHKTAVNWGGYDASGAELTGSESVLPSTLGNANTRDFHWKSGTPYLLRIFRSPDRGWRGSITDLTTDEVTIVRDLWAEGDRLTSPMVWSEVFADCDHPSVAVIWSDFEARGPAGELLKPRAVRVNYQTLGDGGCTNTNSEPTANGFVQRTNARRTMRQGAVLSG